MSYENISKEIEEIFKEKEEIPLFYVESGSRLWGFSGIDSDFDIRGFHLLSKKQAYDFRKQRDTLEIMEQSFDFVSFSLDKMFSLLLNSNPSVFEWIRSHIHYFNRLPNWEEFQRELIENFNLIPLYYHYLSLAQEQFKQIESKKKSNYKTVLHCVRGIFSAKAALEGILPALNIKELFNQTNFFPDLKDIGNESVQKKLSLKEAAPLAAVKHKEIVKMLEMVLKEMSVSTIFDPNKKKREKLGEFLGDYSFTLKNKYYS